MRSLGASLAAAAVLAATAAAAAPGITVTKTVGTVPGVCATTSEITVLPGTTVYYCYGVRNTGDVSLGIHDLVDSQLGTLLTGIVYTLAPGVSVDTVLGGFTFAAVIDDDTTNTATWTAYNTGPTDVATAQASATVTVSPPAIALRVTVGTTPGVCAAAGAITVNPWTTVYYCYTVTNLSDITVTSHDLTDSRLGTLLTGVPYALAPGANISTVDGGLTYSAVIHATTVSTATWTVHVAGSPATATATGTATVTVAPPIPALDPAGLAALVLLLAMTGIRAATRRG
jgi:hypothetical protein